MPRVIEQSNRHVARIDLERKVEAKRAVKFTRRDPVPKAPVEFLYIGAGSNLLEEIPPYDFLSGQTRKPLFVSVIPMHNPFAIELDDSIRQRIQFGVAD